MNFASLLRKAADIYRDEIAVVCDDRQLRYSELWIRSCKLANSLLKLGLKPGDRVATITGNALENIEETCAIAMAGLVRCPMYTFNTAEVHAYLFNLVGARAVILQGQYGDALRQVGNQLPLLEFALARGASRLPNSLDYEAFLSQSPKSEPDVAVSDESNYCIRFSAGTTGRPKGIVHTHRGWRQMGQEFSLSLPTIEEGDAFLAATSISHGSGLWIWEMIARGGRYVIMPTFDASRFLELVERHHCTMTIVVPTMLQEIALHPDAKRYDLRSLKAVVYGAAPVSERTLTEVAPILGKTLYQMYGQSEVLPATILTPKYHLLEEVRDGYKYLNSAGRPTPNCVIKILDDNGKEMPSGELGEVCVLSPGAMKEIWGDAEATNARITSTGFVRTRDIGFLDKSGFLFLCDRKDDLIISGGYNIWPAEVENALASHEAVLEAAVIGVPDSRWGETVLGVVVLRNNCRASEDELILWCRDRVGAIKKPTRVVFSAEPLPKSGVGKVLRRQLRAKFWQGEARNVRGS
jgi:acyl-CoA synthetase (AMP-forming)/AMP-acid ligase II